MDRGDVVLRLLGLSACGPSDTVFFAFSYGSFIGFWGAHYCCEKMGCLVIPSGNMTTEQPGQADRRDGRHRRLRDADLRPAHGPVAEQMGIDLKKDGKVRRVVISGEPAEQHPVKRLIERCGAARRATPPA